MSNEALGVICYGILFNEGTAFPWSEDGFEVWWYKAVHPFKSSIEVWDNYRYKQGLTTEDVHTYYREKREFEQLHPCPFVFINAFSYYNPIWILAVKDTEIRARNGYPLAFDLDHLKDTETMSKMLLEFCQEHNIQIDDSKPRWYLASYWG